MAPQNKVEATIRIRDNQRRSRARRKEYLQQLEERIQAYESERKDAQDVQQVNSAILQENRVLRSLLHQTGFPAAHIEHYIQLGQSSDGEGALARPPSTASRLSDVSPPRYTAQIPLSPPTSSVTSRRDSITEAVLPAETLRRPPSSSVGYIARSKSSEPRSCSTATMSIPATNADRNWNHRIADEYTTQRDNATRATPDVPKDATSCAEAASIIASIRGDDDSQIRAELQCSVPPAFCHIANSRLFEILNA